MRHGGVPEQEGCSRGARCWRLQRPLLDGILMPGGARSADLGRHDCKRGGGAAAQPESIGEGRRHDGSGEEGWHGDWASRGGREVAGKEVVGPVRTRKNLGRPEDDG